MTLAIVPSTSDFFVAEIEKISRRHGLSLNPILVQYLSEVLVKFAASQELKLVSPRGEKAVTPTEFWMEVQKLPPAQQFIALQFLGDYSLFTTGFFGEYVKSSILDMDYFQALGGKAYYRAGEIRESLAAERAINVYFSLSESFKSFSEIFSELFDQTLFHNNEGALKLFQKWQGSGSDRLSRMLLENGFQTSRKLNEG